MSEPDRNKPVLVYLANGVRGGAIVHALARDGRTVRALVRDTGKARTLLRPGVMPVRGDFADPASLQAASTGAGSLILQIPTGAEAQMRTWAEAAIAAARAGESPRSFSSSPARAGQPHAPSPASSRTRCSKRWCGSRASNVP